MAHHDRGIGNGNNVQYRWLVWAGLRIHGWWICGSVVPARHGFKDIRFTDHGSMYGVQMDGVWTYGLWTNGFWSTDYGRTEYGVRCTKFGDGITDARITDVRITSCKDYGRTDYVNMD